jgi:hypothetical protein
MTTHSSSQAQHGGYSLVRVEQLSQAPPANDRSTRYTGPDGLDYRAIHPCMDVEGGLHILFSADLVQRILASIDPSN